MNNRFVGSDAREVIRKWEREDPTIRIEIEKAKEKKKIAYLNKLCKINRAEHCSSAHFKGANHGCRNKKSK